MKGSGDGGEVRIKSKYVFFSDPEIVAKRAEFSGGILGNQNLAKLRQLQQCGSQPKLSDIGDVKANPKYVETFLGHQSIQPHPFTFITAVKRKLALTACNDTSKRAYKLDGVGTSNARDGGLSKIEAIARGSLSKTIQKMDFVKPLKIPDVKISPKTLDYNATKETQNLREVAVLKANLTGSSQKMDKGPKNSERAHRKLDFSLSDGHSFVSSDDIEPLRAPDFSITPSHAKHKDYARDNSREKENRIKRVKREDAGLQKSDDTSQECGKRGKNAKHVSRKDVTEAKRGKNDRFAIQLPKDSGDATSNKPKRKNFATSTLKKDDDKRNRSASSTKGSRDRSLESRGRTFSSESLSDRNCKAIYEKNSLRDQSRGNTDSEASVLKYNDDYQILNALRQLEEHKQKSGVDAMKPQKALARSMSQPIQHKSNETTAKEQHKRIADRAKGLTSKSQIRGISEIMDETDDQSDSTKNRSMETSQQSRSKILEPSDSQQSVESSIPGEHESSDEMLLDPTKISFRDDSYSQQEEFCNLMTPDMNLMVRSKRRKHVPAESEPETELKPPKHKSRVPENSQLAAIVKNLSNPTALHMQFQAELHLFDSYNESLRQVMDVEKCLYTVNQERGREQLDKPKLVNDELKKRSNVLQAERQNSEDPIDARTAEEIPRGREDDKNTSATSQGQNEPGKTSVLREEDSRKTRPETENKPEVRVAETQTANDIATQTETRISAINSLIERPKHSGITYERGDFDKSLIPELSLGSFEQFDLDHIEELSLPSKMRAMSEISLHETTSSIKTETGTEISISTRDVTCSFNRNLDLEMAQLIKDEKLMYDKIEMLFKSREKTLNDRTRKLVKLEEQKRALRDTGQDSRISSVKKKQRALLLKLQQEKDEMNRLKELHKIASQERKLMLQKQRNMFNPQMSTKNILTKLKRSADCQSPRRLSGPMKGYDIRSNSSMSSLVDSDKSQLDRSHIDLKIQLSDSSNRFEAKSAKSDLDASEKMTDSSNRKAHEPSTDFSVRPCHVDGSPMWYDNVHKPETKNRKFEEKMPNLRSNYLARQRLSQSPSKIIEANDGSKNSMQNHENPENQKSESDTLVEELSKKLKNQDVSTILSPEASDGDLANARKSKASQVTEDLIISNKPAKKSEKPIAERETSKKTPHELKPTSKRKGGKSVKGKTPSGILTENILRSKGIASEENSKMASKRTKNESREMSENQYQSSILEELDLNESENSLQALVKHSRAVKDKNHKLLRDIACENETKENILARNIVRDKKSENREDSRKDENDHHNLGNISTRSQVSTFTISRHSSGDSEKSFSRSVVIRAQDHRFKTSKKLEQALNAREAALTTRRNCVEDWIAWHTKLKAEENRVARMEQAAFKLVSATANAFPYHDTTVSSDTSDVEGRVELLAEKLAERRVEMSKLKREARRQAKQRLKALEANLLNQIKKYDTTIHEMRKKLETQKGSSKASEKLAIESRSIEDFKVPEIPIKRIQEIYKSSDLLRSRSDSDLIFAKTLQQDEMEKNSSANRDTSATNVSTYGAEKTSSRQTGSRDLRSDQSAESVLEEAKNFAQNNAEKMSEASSGRETQIASRESVAYEDSTKSRTIATEIVDEPETVSSAMKSNGIRPEISNEISESIQTAVTEESSKLFSQKLESLQLTNKNLNDDISTLENDLRALSEMMSHFSKKSDEKLKSSSLPVAEEGEIATVVESSDKATSQDISEELSRSARSNFREEASSVPEKLENYISEENIPENSDVTSIIEKSGLNTETHGEFDDDKTTENASNSVLDPSIMRPSEEVDFEARSKEILNVIERSIISTHVAARTSDANLQESENEKSASDSHALSELPQDLSSLEGDLKSISEMISEAGESEQNVGLTSNFTEISQNSEEIHDSNNENSPILRIESENQIAEIDARESEARLDENTEEASQKLIIASEKKSHEEYERGDEKLPDEIPDDRIESQTTIIDEKSAPIEEESIDEEISQGEDDQSEGSFISKKSDEGSREDDLANETRSKIYSSDNLENESDEGLLESEKISIGRVDEEDRNDWTVSESFQAPNQIQEFVEQGTAVEASEYSTMNFSDESRGSPDSEKREIDDYNFDEPKDVSIFVPGFESTTIGCKFDESTNNDAKVEERQTDELDDILDIIARESRESEENQRVPKVPTADEADKENVPESKSGKSDDRIIPRPTDLNLTAEVEPVLQKLTEILQGVERKIALRRKNGGNSAESSEIPKSHSLKAPNVTPEPTSDSVSDSKISHFDIDRLDDQISDIETLVAEIIFSNVDQESQKDSSNDLATENQRERGENREIQSVEVEKEIPIIDFVQETENCGNSEPARETITKLAEKTFEILRDPEYEDISEESLEVSEILDKTESQRSSSLSRHNKIPEKYEIKQKSEDVLRILDEISQQSYNRLSRDEHVNDVQISVQVFGSVSPGFTSKKISNEATIDAAEPTLQDAEKSMEIVEQDEEENVLAEAKIESKVDEILEKIDNDVSSESSEGADTPRGVSEIEMDSPRDPNESRLDIDALDDDLLSIGDSAKSQNDDKVEFPVGSSIVSSEKDIEAMIDKLKASLEQPGLEVAELEAKLLRIEQLQIELEIKKLEAEEVSYYVREIPNKPPPPYTPPGGGRLTTPQLSPTLPPAVVPSNVEELTAFTEKATILIFNAKNSGDDIMSLEPPLEFCELSKDNNEVAKQDRRIYNTFLFDLCKETIAELYRSEYEKPGPSWTKPNVKTKPAMKIPKTIDELNEYVSKEVATLFGFKTKLQRENMVMRWSRKRRDRVDELLAREAQAEEDEWTKFHHDELAVKNELTVAILDTLILETTSVVKAVYAKKRKVVA